MHSHMLPASIEKTNKYYLSVESMHLLWDAQLMKLGQAFGRLNYPIKSVSNQ